MNEYRIRQAHYVTGLLTGNKTVKTEWVVEKKRDRMACEDDYQYEQFCWEPISSGDTEIAAKKWLVLWLQAEIETAEIPENEYAD